MNLNQPTPTPSNSNQRTRPSCIDRLHDIKVTLDNMASPSPANRTNMPDGSASSSSNGTKTSTGTSVAAVTKTCMSSNLASLTDEIMLEVLYCVSPLEILRHVCRVSKRLAGITTSRDTDLRYWRYHPSLPRSLKERIQAGDDGNKKRKAATAASGGKHSRGSNSDNPGAPSLKLERRQLQMLVCLCANKANKASDTSPRHLHPVDLLPSQEAVPRSLEIYGGLMLRSRACLASSQDHEHEDITRVLRHARIKKNSDNEVIRRLRDRQGGRQEEDSDENGGGDGGGDTTDDADEDDDERIRQGQAVPPASGCRDVNPSYDVMWEYISRQEEDRGPPYINGHIDLGFFMQVMRQDGSYWSSMASENCDSNEVLLFATQGCCHSLITDVAAKPFRELRLDQEHVPYTWPAIVLSVYSLPDVEDYAEDCGEDEGNRTTSAWSSGNVTEPPSSAMERQRRQQDPFVTSSNNPIGHSVTEEQNVGNYSDSHSSCSNPIPAILAGHVPVYTSPPRECDATNTGWQHFKLPPGIVGNVVVFSLQGKYHRQFPESGYYVCCERVECRGVPLWTGP